VLNGIWVCPPPGIRRTTMLSHEGEASRAQLRESRETPARPGCNAGRSSQNS